MPGNTIVFLQTKIILSPGRVPLLVRAPSRNAKVAGWISGQGTYKKQPMNALSKGNNKSMFLSLSPPPLWNQ